MYPTSKFVYKCKPQVRKGLQKKKLAEKTAIKSSWFFLMKLIGWRYHRHVYFFDLQNKIETVVSHIMILARITNRLQGKS